MENLVYILIIGLANYLLKALPFLFFGDKQFPQLLKNWLEYVPIAVLCSILAPMLLINSNSFDLSVNNTMLLASIPTIIIGILTRNMGLILILGILFMALIQYFIN